MTDTTRSSHFKVPLVIIVISILVITNYKYITAHMKFWGFYQAYLLHSYFVILHCHYLICLSCLELCYQWIPLLPMHWISQVLPMFTMHVGVFKNCRSISISLPLLRCCLMVLCNFVKIFIGPFANSPPLSIPETDTFCFANTHSISTWDWRIFWTFQNTLWF